MGRTVSRPRNEGRGGSPMSQGRRPFTHTEKPEEPIKVWSHAHLLGSPSGQCKTKMLSFDSKGCLDNRNC